MSKMCKMNSSCSTCQGMCVHEKMMMTVVVATLLGIAVYWFI